MAEDPSLAGSIGRGQRAVQEEPLDAILSPELDKMVTEGECRLWLFKFQNFFRQKLIRDVMLCSRCHPQQTVQNPR